MRTLWRDDVASYSGEFVRFDTIRVNPKPVRDRRIPIVLGGNSDAALRRVVGWGDGWYGFYLDDVAAVAARVQFVDKLCGEAGRDRRELSLAVALRQPRDDRRSGVGGVGHRRVGDRRGTTRWTPRQCPTGCPV